MALRVAIDLTDVYGIIEEKIIPTMRNEYIKDKRVASKKLINSLDNWDASFEDDHYILNLNLPDYWEQVDKGRKPTSGITGIDWKEPIKDISQWMINKHIRPAGGRSISDVAYLIVRKIHKLGYKGSNTLEHAVDKCEPYFNDIAEIISSQLGREVEVEIDKL